MLKMETVRAGHRAIGQIEELYARAFPENERRPLDALMDDETGVGELLGLYEGDVFCGFACVLNWQDISHVIYIAVEEGLRGRGYGTQALEALFRRRQGQRMIVDVEAIVPGVHNERQRRRRMEFYRRLGYAETEVRYTWREEDYVILCRGGQITREQFGRFWQEIGCLNPAMEQY